MDTLHYTHIERRRKKIKEIMSISIFIFLAISLALAFAVSVYVRVCASDRMPLHTEWEIGFDSQRQKALDKLKKNDSL